MNERTEIRGQAELQELLAELHSKERQMRVVVTSVNITKRGTGVKIGQFLAEHVYLSSSVIRSNQYLIPMEPASRERPFSGFRVGGYPIEARTDGSTGKYKATALRGGVKLYLRRDKGPELFRHAWEDNGRVKIRRAPDDPRVKKMYGPSIPNAMAESGTLDRVMDYANERFLTVAEQQVDRWLARQTIEDAGE